MVQQQCNILLMQETHFSQNIENKLIQDFKGSLYQSNGISNSRGKRGGNLDKKECRVQIN